MKYIPEVGHQFMAHNKIYPCTRRTAKQTQIVLDGETIKLEQINIHSNEKTFPLQDCYPITWQEEDFNDAIAIIDSISSAEAALAVIGVLKESTPPELKDELWSCLTGAQKAKLSGKTEVMAA